MLDRRRALQTGLAALSSLPAVSRLAWAEAYPSPPARLIVGYPAGIAPDIVARLMGQSLSERLGQQFAVVNRPGGGSTVGTETVAHAVPDGYTLLMMTVGSAISAKLYDDLDFDYVRDIVPVASLGGGPFVMLIHPSVPAKTVPEFIAYAKANPGKLNMGSTGNGTAPHVFGELFKMMAGVDMVHVPYRGNYIPDLLAGRLQVYFTVISGAIDYVKAGKLRALALTTTTQLEVLPDVPPMSKFLPGYEANGWYGIGAPKGTPAEIIEKLNQEINAALADDAMKARYVSIGVDPTPVAKTPAEFGKFVAAETEKWAKVIKFAGIKPE